jgi:predicted deacylase
MARAFTLSQPTDLTEALGQAVLRLAEKASIVLNLHSAGDARYLSHVIFYRAQDVDRVASMGFPFAIKRGTPETLAHHIFTYLRPEQFTATLELGGGTFAFPEDATLAIDLIMAYLGRNGFLEPGNYKREPTPRERIWLADTRQLVRAPGEGAFYTHARLGTDFTYGEPFGLWVGLDDLQPYPLLTPVTGELIYLRTRNRVPQGETLAMFLPPQHASNITRTEDDYNDRS